MSPRAIAPKARAHERFLATAGHDLRQPVHALGLLSAALADRLEGSEHEKLAGLVLASTRELQAMFETLLDQAKLDAGAWEPASQGFPIGPILERIARELEPEARAKRLRLHAVATGLRVQSDPNLLARLLEHLVRNAIRYTDEGGVVLGVRRHGRSVSVCVVDSGIGIAADQHERIFEDYSRVDESRRGDGLGLGLGIVGRLAALLGHELELASEPGRGSCFGVRVPRAAPALATSEPGLADSQELRGRTVLVLDDEPAIRHATRALLEPLGCRVWVAAAPEEALALCATEASAPDAILADLDLGPGVRGTDAVAALRRALALRVPAAILTGDTDPAAAEEIRAAGLPHLSKPVAPMRLRSTLAHLLRRSPG